MKDLKAEFDSFYDAVEKVVIDLVQSDYSSTETFIINFEWLKQRYFDYADTVTEEDKAWLCENHLPAFVNLMQVATTVAAIGSTLEHVTRPQAGSAIH